jgi:uncharacterized membrane protein
MWWQWLGVAVAGVGALLHVVFAYSETLGWGPQFVGKVAPSWGDPELNKEHISWAWRLAFNIGAYNLVLAVGLAWTCWAFCTPSAMAGPLGYFFAFWLLAAAAAAFHTKVFPAFGLQGALGALLLIAAIGVPKVGG